MSYEGSCHCGAVSFQVDGEVPTEAMSCNCSHCRRKGLLLSFIPSKQLTLMDEAGVLSDYLFNKHAITHRFCVKCGCQPFASGKGPDGTEVTAINLRCVATIDIDGLTIHKVDGASF